MKKYLSVFALLTFISMRFSSQKAEGRIIDVNATRETKTLYYNLGNLSEKHILKIKDRF